MQDEGWLSWTLAWILGGVIVLAVLAYTALVHPDKFWGVTLVGVAVFGFYYFVNEVVIEPIQRSIGYTTQNLLEHIQRLERKIDELRYETRPER